MNIGKEIYQIKLSDIIPNRFQPRMNFDEKSIKELADSIKQHGLIQPLVLRKVQNKYEIIAGERRYKAASMLGLEMVPAIVVNLDDASSAEIAVVENIQRTALSPIEEAKAYQRLLEVGSLTQGQLASRMGKTQPTVANKLRLLNLDEQVQNALLNNQISERHARSLLTVKDPNLQRKILEEIISKRLTVRQTDELIKNYLNAPSPLTQASSDPVSSLQIDNNTVQLSKLNVKNPVLENNLDHTQILNPIDIQNKDFHLNTSDETVDIDKLMMKPQSNSMFQNITDFSSQNKSSSLEDLETNIDIPFNKENTISNKNHLYPSEPSNLNEKYMNELNQNYIDSSSSSVQPDMSFLLDDKLDFEEPDFNLASSSKTEFPPAPEPFYTNLEEDKKDPELVNVEITPRIKNAINMTRNFVQELEDQGIRVEMEEINLLKDYQFIIKITK